MASLACLKTRTRAVAPPLGALLLLSGLSHDAPAREWTIGWTVGAGVSQASEPYRDAEGASQAPDAEFQPYLELSAGPLSLTPESAAFTVLERTFLPGAPTESDNVDDGLAFEWEVAADVYLEFDSGDRDQGADTIFVGMDPRAGQTVVGVAAELTAPVGLFSIDLAHYDGAGSAGHQIRLAWGIPLWQSERIDLYADAGIDWYSTDRLRFEYGVAEQEATPDRPVWNPDSAIQPRAGLVVQYSPLAHWSLFGILDVARRADAVRDSPLTDDESSDVHLEIGVLFSSD